MDPRTLNLGVTWTWEGGHGTHWTAGWMEPRASMDAVQKRKHHLPLPGNETRLLGCPARSLDITGTAEPALS